MKCLKKEDETAMKIRKGENETPEFNEFVFAVDLLLGSKISQEIRSKPEVGSQSTQPRKVFMQKKLEKNVRCTYYFL